MTDSIKTYTIFAIKDEIESHNVKEMHTHQLAPAQTG